MQLPYGPPPPAVHPASGLAATEAPPPDAPTPDVHPPSGRSPRRRRITPTDIAQGVGHGLQCKAEGQQTLAVWLPTSVIIKCHIIPDE